MTDPIQANAPAAPAAALTDVERKKVADLAHQFESMLMTQMLREMRKSMLTEEPSEGGYGAAAMTDTVDVELGSALSRSSGLGLSDMLIKAFDRQASGRHPSVPSALPASIPAVLPAGVPSASSTAAPDRSIVPAAGLPGSAPINPAVAPVSTASPNSSPEPGALSDSRTSEVGEPAPAAANPVLPEGRVTSNFGWRNDPFTGQVKFHSGTDVKMAYGQDVHSAADGRVSFVGEQSGYGLTVAIDHGNGVTTRYAHLSETTVRAGDSVNSGQVVARSGNSGRSTGPHLHFEVLENGRAIAPETIGQLLH